MASLQAFLFLSVASMDPVISALLFYTLIQRDEGLEKDVVTKSSDSMFENIHAFEGDDAIDWCHIRESIKVLILAMAQIELSLTDGEHNVTNLGALFTDMADHLGEVNDFLSTQSDTPVLVMAHSTILVDKVNEGVVAFQFYDRISQRLQHVIMGLALMEEVLSSKERRTSQDAWKKLQEGIQESYSLDCERKMFDLLLKGTPVHEALKLYKEEYQKEETEDDIELF